MSKGGAERRRAGEGAPPNTSSRVTAPAARTGPTRRTNWMVVVMIALVMVGLVGGYFAAFAGDSTPASTTSTSTTSTLAP